MEFGTTGASTKPTMICYFYKYLKSSVQVNMDKQNQASTNIKKKVQRVVNLEAIVDLSSSGIIWDLDTRCSKRH